MNRQDCQNQGKLKYRRFASLPLLTAALLGVSIADAFAPDSRMTHRKLASSRASSLQAVEILADVPLTIAATSEMVNPTLSTTAFTSAVNTFFETQPYLAGFLTCSFKASAADMIAQTQEESNEDEDTIPTYTAAMEEDSALALPEVDVSRNLGFLLYGGLYTGVFQNFLYTVLFPAWFGTDESLLTIIKQVVADNLVFGPLLCLPVAYAFKGAFTSEDGLSIEALKTGLNKYIEDVSDRNLLKMYWAIWVPAQFLTFSVIPPHFRVVFVALVSFFWFGLLSSVSAAESDSSQSAKPSS